MTSDKKNISLLADIFTKSGLTDIVISSGSRNAPIILSFANRSGINAFSIVDERSAAFFALGLALNSNKTVALACTSGSAVLNYASAISEAYYQKIPLLILTADRPPHLIDVGDGQTVQQNGIFNNYIKKSYQLPLVIDSVAEITKAENIINEAIYICTFPKAGPVHINIPFDEPIYGTTKKQITGSVININHSTSAVADSVITEITNICNKSRKVMIIAGQSSKDKKLNDLLETISQNKNTIILTETTSNLYCENFIDTIDNVISTIKKDEIVNFKPEIVISFGGQVVSKMVKKFLRNNKPDFHWHISSSGEKMDTYKSLTKVIEVEDYYFFSSLYSKLLKADSNYASIWLQRKSKTVSKRNEYLSKIEYSDLKVFESIITNLPQGCILHLGNSTPVRYSQLFGSTKGITYQSNRGVSGIDGQVSTAVGYAFNSSKLNVLITGDLGFLYDSNGLMNKYLKPNLRIIVINNSGGGIFKFIPGPDTTPNLDEFFVAKHNWKAEYICKAFDVKYSKTENLDELNSILPNFLSLNKKAPEVLEIFTPSDLNAEILRRYFSYVKS